MSRAHNRTGSVRSPEIPTPGEFRGEFRGVCSVAFGGSKTRWCWVCWCFFGFLKEEKGSKKKKKKKFGILGCLRYLVVFLNVF